LDALNAGLIQQHIQLALLEDVADGDKTAQLLAADSQSNVEVICREDMIACGSAWFDETFRQLDPAIQIDWMVQDGNFVTANSQLCHLSGASRALLTGERTALNYLQSLSATATVTHHYVKAVRGTGVTILDTRKTVPGLRLQQKYAVTCGGGSNHRMGLFDALLIKENHILAAGSIKQALDQALHLYPKLEIEIEVESLDEFQQALDAGAKRVLLDNFSLDQLSHAVRINQNKARLEASGNVSLSTIRDIANTGIHDISIGALTKNIHAIDLSMRFNKG